MSKLASCLVMGAVVAITACGRTGAHPEVRGEAGVAGATEAEHGGTSTGGVATGGVATGGTVGEAGTVSDAGAGGGPEAPEFGAVEVVGGSADGQYWDLTVVGRDLQAHDGKVVTVRVGRGPSAERLGLGRTRIEDGKFELRFEQVWEMGMYKAKHVYVDVNEDGVCTPNVDAVFSDASASPAEVMLVTPGGEPGAAAFQRSFSPERDCESLNAPWPD